jgi:AcrR family transcriptional regulator
MATTKRKPLSRDRILAAALAVADEQGIEALSMRKLGQMLGFEAMSLYNHVASKDDLLDGILDLVLAEMEPPAPDGGLPAIRRSAVAAHEALRRHPWAAQLLMLPGHVRPARLAYMEALLACLRGAGFSADVTYHAYHVVDAHIVGFSLWQASHSAAPANVEDMREWFERMIPAETFPNLHEHGLQHMHDGPHRELSAFEFALDLLLESLAKLRAKTR